MGFIVFIIFSIKSSNFNLASTWIAVDCNSIDLPYPHGHNVFPVWHDLVAATVQHDAEHTSTTVAYPPLFRIWPQWTQWRVTLPCLHSLALYSSNLQTLLDCLDIPMVQRIRFKGYSYPPGQDTLLHSSVHLTSSHTPLGFQSSNSRSQKWAWWQICSSQIVSSGSSLKLPTVSPLISACSGPEDCLLDGEHCFMHPVRMRWLTWWWRQSDSPAGCHRNLRYHMLIM